MNRRSEASAVRPPGHEETIAPVTILDAHGRVMQVIPAEEFRRTRAVLTRAAAMGARRRTSPSAASPGSLIGEESQVEAGCGGSLTIATAQP